MFGYCTNCTMWRRLMQCLRPQEQPPPQPKALSTEDALAAIQLQMAKDLAEHQRIKKMIDDF